MRIAGDHSGRSTEGHLSVLPKTGLLFVGSFLLYFISRSPGLDEYDSVQFAMGVLRFNIWDHQPHPPGYPLFIFLGWIGHQLGLSPEMALQIVSSLGGALFVTMWFRIIRLQFNERIAWWVTFCLALTPAVWMTATKVLTDTLAAGLLSGEILAVLWFTKRNSRSAMVFAALLGAATAGARPQLILIVFIVLATGLKQAKANWKLWLFSTAILIVACMAWLLPMWYLQAQLRPDLPGWLAYPTQVYAQWRWRLDRPHVFIGAGDWSPRYLSLRLGEHILGWFGLGFGLLQSPIFLVIGTALILVGFFAYFASPRSEQNQTFWKFHRPWAIVHFLTIFICLDAAQRYYLIIFPLLLIALLQGFWSLPLAWSWTASALPVLLALISIPTAWQNHYQEAPPIRLIRFLQQAYPFSARNHVILLLKGSRRHAEWYAPEFNIAHNILSPQELKEFTKDSTAVYTDDEDLVLPLGWRRVPVAEFQRSLVIYIKHHVTRLFLIDRGTSP